MKLLIFSFLIYYSILSAQFLHPRMPYERIQYSGLNPLWHETSYDATMNGDSLDGYNQFYTTLRRNDEIFYNDMVIIPSTCRSPYGYSGAYLECRSIKDGQLLWQQRYSLIENDHVEFLAMMYIDESERLVVIGHKEKVPFRRNEFYNYVQNMVLTKRIYNLYTGELLSYTHRDYNDPLAFPTADSPLRKSGSSRVFKEHENLRYIESYNESGIRYVKSCLLDHTGALLSNIDTMVVPYYRLNFNFEQLHPDTLLEVEMNVDERVLYFRYLSPKLKLYYEIASDTLEFSPANMTLEKISEDKTKILFSNLIQESGSPSEHFELLSFDLKGRKLKSGFMENTIQSFHAIEWEDESDKFIVVGSEFKEINDTTRSTFQVYKLGPNKYKERIKEFVSSDPYRSSFVVSCKKVDDSNYYLRLREIAWYGSQILFRDRHAVAYSQMIIPMMNLTLTTSTNDDISSDYDVDIFPNPSQDYCVVGFNYPFSGTMDLIDINGKFVLRQNFNFESNISIDISHLISGVYYLNFYNSNGKVLTSKKLLKIAN